MRQLLIFLLLFSRQLHAVELSDLDFVIASSLPPNVRDALSAQSKELSKYVLSSHVNPYYLQGDFNGDGRTDIALLLKNRTTDQSGILILDGASGRSTVLGAGNPLGNGGDDFRWMDAWHVYPRGQVEQGAHDGDPPRLKGDGLMLIKTESSSGIVYWTGTQYAWYQQGD